jgi:hypothetical protein
MPIFLHAVCAQSVLFRVRGAGAADTRSKRSSTGCPVTLPEQHFVFCFFSLQSKAVM